MQKLIFYKVSNELRDDCIVFSALRKLKRCGIDVSDMYCVIRELEKEIDYYREVINAFREKNIKAKETQKIYFVCDRRACKNCDPLCYYTSNIEHARNFEFIGGIPREREENIVKK